MSQLMTIFLLAKSLHFLVRIIPAVHTRGLHFTGLPFRSSQITKPVIQRWRHIWDENVTIVPPNFNVLMKKKLTISSLPCRAGSN